MPERRSTERPGSSDRRSFPRPPLWLTTSLLALSIVGLLLARWHRSAIDRQLAASLAQQPDLSLEMQQAREQIAGMNLTEDALKNEVAARMKLAESLDSNDFYIAIDTSRKQFGFHYGNEIVREAPVVAGEARSIDSPATGKAWTFTPLRGAFQAVGKESDYDWSVPEWVYLLAGQPSPPSRATARNWLGRYVIVLPNGYVIHSPPPPDSPLKGPKPGSFMVPEEDLRAIWPRVGEGTKVFVF